MLCHEKGMILASYSDIFFSQRKITKCEILNSVRCLFFYLFLMNRYGEIEEKELFISEESY